MTSSPRARRLAKRIGEIVATAIDREIKDPRLHYVTITDVRLTGDLHDATVYYTVRGETLDAAHHRDVAAFGQRHRQAGATSATRAADAVDVILGMGRHVEIEDVADAFDIKPARCDV